jgi:enamine deaminase RidA (YjgF/YER057c/UK114 family)
MGRGADLWVRRYAGAGHRELLVHVGFPDLAARDPVLREALSPLVGPGAPSILRAFVFGSRREHARVVGALAANPSRGFPVTWVQGAGTRDGEVEGMFIHAVEGLEVRPLESGGRVVGTAISDDDFDQVFLGGLTSASGPSAGRAEQLREVLDLIRSALAGVSMDLNDVVRTWFYNERIVDWYPEFNAVRTDVYLRDGVLERRIPASTAIEGTPPDATALVAAAVAMRPRRRGASARPIASPVQGSATRYGSSFSRAMLVESAARRTLLVSGTASIDRDGRTRDRDDVGAQIDNTIEAVRALLHRAELDLDDVRRSFVYVKRREDRDTARALLTRKLGERFPMILVGTNICREELLFELELDATRGDAEVHP